ncbi:chitinase [Obelidium mucronatum]|nr:chitinase [Obelidium mucronatum]
MALAAVGVNARAVGPDGKILVAYLPYWDGIRASYMDFSKVTHVNYAFANIDSTGAVTLPAADTSIITNFAADCHAGDAKAIVSIGGWGIQPFSTAFASAAGINTFVSTVSALMTKYNLDGIDIDWEYPGEQGACQNPWSTADTANFLTALKALRAAIPGKLITAAPPAYPWKDATGQPSKDLSAYAQIFDFVNLMAYDLNGIWGTHTGASAPLIQDVGNLGTPGGNVRDAVKSWLAAGFPASKLALGTPFYGHYMSPVSPMTNNKDSDINVPVIKGSTGHDCAGAGLGGTFTFVQVYPYTQDTTGEWIKHFDTWTQTPWLYNPKTNIFISYDDSRSIAIKAAYAACMGLKGVMTW